MPFRNPGSTYSSKRSSKGTSVPEEQTLEFYNAYISGNEMPTEGDGYIYIKNLSRSAVITNVKSSNKYYTASKASWS